MKVLRTDDVLEALGIGRSTLYDWRRDGRFPEPIKLGPQAVGWLESDLRDWLEANRQGQAGE